MKFRSWILSDHQKHSLFMRREHRKIYIYIWSCQPSFCHLTNKNSKIAFKKMKKNYLLDHTIPEAHFILFFKRILLFSSIIVWTLDLFFIFPGKALINLIDVRMKLIESSSTIYKHCLEFHGWKYPKEDSCQAFCVYRKSPVYNDFVLLPLLAFSGHPKCLVCSFFNQLQKFSSQGYLSNLSGHPVLLFAIFCGLTKESFNHYKLPCFTLLNSISAN